MKNPLKSPLPLPLSVIWNTASAIAITPTLNTLKYALQHKFVVAIIAIAAANGVFAPAIVGGAAGALAAGVMLPLAKSAYTYFSDSIRSGLTLLHLSNRLSMGTDDSAAKQKIEFFTTIGTVIGLFAAAAGAVALGYLGIAAAVPIFASTVAFGPGVLTGVFNTFNKRIMAAKQNPQQAAPRVAPAPANDKTAVDQIKDSPEPAVVETKTEAPKATGDAEKKAASTVSTHPKKAMPLGGLDF